MEGDGGRKEKMEEWKAGGNEGEWKERSDLRLGGSDTDTS